MSGILGIHHVTGIASDPQRNLDFYAGILGLRLVKRTVNFDDPHTYHFYFGDETGTPGSLLTFFPWPGARRGRIGAGQVAVTSFGVAQAAIGFWVERLIRHGVAFEGPTQRRNVGAPAEQVIAFRDPDGLMLEIVGHPGAASRPSWQGAAGIPAGHALHGIHAVALWVASHEETGRLLTDTLGLHATGEDGESRHYAAAEGGTGGVTVRAVAGFPRGADGAGTVHHVAWRVSDDASQVALREAVIAAGHRPTPVIDRQYFHSVYFREPGGVLFEIATDTPGFMTDERVDRLGEALKLPPQYESARASIEAALPAIRLPGASSAEPQPLDFIHRYQPGEGPAGRVTLLILHGTGGNEDDLLPLGRMLLPGAGMLSPRGKVMENGKPRFFRRLAEGVFDLEDLAKRTTELAAFIDAASSAYQLDRAGIVAVGFSNGANIAASLLLSGEGRLRAAVLLSPMVPFEPSARPDLDGAAVFIAAGRTDPIVPQAQVERLAGLLREGGADVTVHWDPGGHTISPGAVSGARAWLESWVGTTT